MLSGSTKLHPDETEGLIPAGITSRADLNAMEHANILAATEWALGGRQRRLEALLTETFLTELHRRMFGEVWHWAGEFRRRDAGLGVPASQIPRALRDALADARIWVGESVYPPRELAARYHHRLVQIHPFTDGNGRWGRLATDALTRAINQPLPTWGVTIDLGDLLLRDAYLAAMRTADNGMISPLIRFMWP